MGKLYVIPTPIGNLEDITYRAVRLLAEVNAVLAEDTRTTGNLLRHFEISNQLIAFHLNNEHKVVDRILSELQNGMIYGLVSDAGTPGISDPGFLLVRACVDAGIEVECLPGATAFVPALVNSGFPTEKFVYEGFLPHKKGRQTRIQKIAEEERTVVFYESPHRLVKALTQLQEVLQEGRRIAVCREISKKFEETLRGTPEELITHFTQHPVKGEFVVVVEAYK
ncbi:16S rRNA (cytidine(1402)-2'-O)-methyltransferase [Paracrocinitomix mangrovi]|uniref:16S rRNA (cytidine(1402)-2'-O)-methyltransferase n=1 Tax=Paracrocinitomix mangrovi TaxID=2862509 RepID=UPI001C8EDB42|nr:16S rRNA (cytidine(1402)-2'-O)-methyltransferase [Paracrocinitomix mangrovi]UKN00490.1 16S rRNA (cytidine(1402)-2'-O)-methyltransferase [Paracrocinitomix mangrovi]